MGDLLDRIKAHADPARRRRIEVPEWATTPGGPPLVITYTMMTLDDMAIVTELDGELWPKRAARIIALKACDEAGNRLFATGDAAVIRETAAPEVVNRVAMQMLGRISIEEAEKN